MWDYPMIDNLSEGTSQSSIKIAPSVNNQMFLAAFWSNTSTLVRMAASAIIPLNLLTT